ncbi:MAG: hypothetical protein IKN48_02570 [Bacteroidaceae bacterium]|nr:hypothetical protein [Bacteroidaceae bacterium]
MGIFNGAHTGEVIDAAVDAVLIRWDATNSNNTLCTSDNVTFAKSGVTIGKNGCTIINNVLGKPFYFAQSNQSVVTLTNATFGVGTSYLWGVFIDSDKLVRGGRVSSIIDCMVCAGISTSDVSAYYSIINNPSRYILFAYIYKGEFTPAGVFAKPEFIGGYA